MRLTVGKKIAIGFGAVIAVLAVGTVVNVQLLESMKRAQKLVIEKTGPASLAATEIGGEVQGSLAALRGYVLLGAEKFKEQRAERWKRIDEKSAALSKLGEELLTREDAAVLARVMEKLAELRKAQDEVEAVAQTEENVHAVKLMKREVSPAVGAMVESIGAMIDIEQKESASAERKALLGALADSRGSLGVGIASLRAFVQSNAASDKADFEKRWAVNGKAFERVEGMKGLFTAEQAAAWTKYSAARSGLGATLAKVVSERERADWNQAIHVLGTKAAPTAAAIQSDMKTITDRLVERSAAEERGLVLAAQRMGVSVFAVAGVSLVLGVVTAVYIARSVSRAVGLILWRMTAVADGDLLGEELSTGTGDEIAEIAHSLNVMSGSLRKVVGEIGSSSNEVAAAATEIAASAEQMTAGVKAQNSQLGEMAGAMSEMNASIAQVANQAVGAAQSADESGKTAKRGAEIVSGTIENMQTIGTQTRESVEYVRTLGERGKQVGQVAQVINDIAEQINLLALNAAIEAARAGEHGRGFAVVADEVRKLADRTSSATKEIAESIKAIQSETTNVVQRIEAGRQSVDVGVQRAATAGESLTEILASVGSVERVVSSIASAAKEQSLASEQISKSIESVNAASQETEAGAGQCATAANQLSTRAERLRTLVARFKV